MTADRSALKNEIVQGLMNAAGEKLPTSSFGRLGRMGFALARSARMISAGRKKLKSGEDQEIDIEKVAGVIASVGRLKGIAMKMGQIMSYIDMAMPDELRDALSVLQTHAQPMPFEKIRELVTAELCEKGTQLLRNMEEIPVSSASIGQVHKARLPSGANVAVKIQYPEIARAIEADFGPAAVGTKMASILYPNARIDDFVKEARSRFLEECDYIHEAHCQNRFAELFEGHDSLVVPAVHREFCSSKVLTTTFVDGLEFDAFLKTMPSQEERNRIGEALFEFYLGSLFRHQLYNCDPHPGNYLFLEGGHIAMLDHGCTRQFETKFVSRLVNLTRAVHRDRREAIHKALLDLNIVREGKKYDYNTIHGFLRSFYGPMLVDAVTKVDLSSAMEMRDVMKKKIQLAKFSLPAEFLFLFRIRFGLMSVLSRLGAMVNWYRLEKRYVEDFSKAHPILSG
ncbi:MAG: AarF/ABC1/UbiB kinase family protein [Deltaproteobacteria bacterium]|nr:AarF/ABC1/UbiB kinase family protein [Deltaproteobacteria bacterium]